MNTSQLNYRLSFQMFMTPSESLAPWVLLLEQGSSSANLDYKNLGYKIYTTVLKNHMQTTLDAIIGKDQTVAIKNRTMLHIFFTIRDIINISHKLNSNSCLNIFEFSWIFYIVDWDSMLFVSLFCNKFVIRKFILPFLSLVMETNSSTWLKLHTPISTLKRKNWSPVWTFYPYMRS